MDGTLAYGACGLLIVVYAWGRFNTPPSNRSSTRQTLYWSSGAGYVLSALGLFVALVILLKSGPWRKFLIGSEADPSLPVPLVATLAMTTLLPSLPYLKRLDEWFLSIFLDWAEIPAEVKRRAATLTPETFHVTREDIAELREAYGDGSYAETLAEHLRRRGDDKLELSQYRFTCVVKLHHAIRRLAARPALRPLFRRGRGRVDGTQPQGGRVSKRLRRLVDYGEAARRRKRGSVRGASAGTPRAVCPLLPRHVPPIGALYRPRGAAVRNERRGPPTAPAEDRIFAGGAAEPAALPD